MSLLCWFVGHFEGRSLVASQNFGCFLRLGKHLSKTKTHFPLVILLPLLPASLRHENPPKRKTYMAWVPLGGKDRSIRTCVFVEIFCSCNYCDSYYACLLFDDAHFLPCICCALKWKDYILISVYCNTGFWSLSSD